MKRKMSEEVAKGEMMRLREQGYSNTEIAEQLECCYATVLRYIGKGGIRRKKKADCAHGVDHTENTVSKDRLIMLSRSFAGGVAQFTVRDDEIDIVFPAENCYVTLKFDKYAEFAKDVLAVSQIMR